MRELTAEENDCENGRRTVGECMKDDQSFLQGQCRRGGEIARENGRSL